MAGQVADSNAAMREAVGQASRQYNRTIPLKGKNR